MQPSSTPSQEVLTDSDLAQPPMHTLDFHVSDQQGMIGMHIGTVLAGVLRERSRAAGLPVPPTNAVDVKTSLPVDSDNPHSRVRGITVLTTLGSEYRALIVSHMQNSGCSLIDTPSTLKIVTEEKADDGAQPKSDAV